MDNTGKFTGKGAVYAAARPRYAEELLTYLADEAGLTPGALVADVGVGHGDLLRAAAVLAAHDRSCGEAR